MMTATVGEYALLRDGGQVLIRPVMPADHAAVAALLAGLSARSRAMRFHSAGRASIRKQSPRPPRVTPCWRCRVIGRSGLASYVPLRDPARAEMAIAVEDAEQGRGVGTALFERLVRRCPARRDPPLRGPGPRRQRADARSAGRPGLPHLPAAPTTARSRWRSSCGPDPAYLARADARLHVAALASLAPLFRPRAVAVVGASRRPGSIGHALFRNLLAGGFAGAGLPGQPARPPPWPRCAPTPPWPPSPSRSTWRSSWSPPRRCSTRRASAWTPGCAAWWSSPPASPRRARRAGGRQDELLALCRAHGARAGRAQLHGRAGQRPGRRMNATFAPTLPPPGTVSISSQSGRAGHRHPGARPGPGPRRRLLRLGRQQGRPLLQRPARVLGGRPGHRA